MVQEHAVVSEKRGSLSRRVISLLLVVPILSLSWLVLVPAPTTSLWIASLFYVELGWAMLLVLVVGWAMLDRSTWRGKVWGVLAIAGMGILLSPWVDVVNLVNSLPSSVGSMGGERKSPGADALDQQEPLMWQRFFWLSHPDVTQTSVTIPVAPGQSLPLDLYKNTLDNKTKPLLVTIHGGAWRSGSQRQLPAINRYFAARGYVVAAITYRLAPTHQYPTQLQDITAALTWLRSQGKKFGYDPDRIALFGRSAGGHLALMAAYRKVAPGIRGVIGLYAPTDMHWSWANPSNPRVINSHDVLSKFLGGPPEKARSNYDQASPIRFVSKETPPTLLIHGLKDDVVSYKHSRRLIQQLRQHGIRSWLVELPWANHGFDFVLRGPSGQLSLYAMERFLRGHLYRKR